MKKTRTRRRKRRRRRRRRLNEDFQRRVMEVKMLRLETWEEVELTKLKEKRRGWYRLRRNGKEEEEEEDGGGGG